MSDAAMTTLALVNAGNIRPEREELKRLETADLYPRASLFQATLNATLIDARRIQQVVSDRKYVRVLPTWLIQVIDAYSHRGDYDAIISWAEHLGIPLALLLKLTNSRTPHIAIFSWISPKKKAELIKYTQSHFDRIVLMSSVQYRHAVEELKIPESKLLLLKWPVDQEFWRPIPAKGDMICSAGREMRDYGSFVNALQDLPIRCHIAASWESGKNDAWSKQLHRIGNLPDNISVGRKNYTALRELYARSRFVVVPLLPTDTDNGTTTILEAMAMGKAVICTRVQGQTDVIEEGITGIFVPPNDPSALREAILHLWSKPDLAEKMGNKGRERIIKYHRLDDWILNVKNTVETVVRLKKSRL